MILLRVINAKWNMRTKKKQKIKMIIITNDHSGNSLICLKRLQLEIKSVRKKRTLSAVFHDKK